LEVTAVERTPELIVRALEKGFERDDEIRLKILEGCQLTEEERSFAAPLGMTVCAGSVKTDDGLGRIQAWFEAKKQKAKRQGA
jgi:DNA-directed RNA polymerase subunit E'/Rpb7